MERKKEFQIHLFFTIWMQINVLNITEDLTVLKSKVMHSYEKSHIASTVYFIVRKSII